jgi:putative ABC transport system permease protein
MFISDLRYSLRILFKEPGFTLVAILTLALGIGANTAIFSVVNGVLLRPLPYPEPDRLVALWESAREGDDLSGTEVIAPANFNDWQTESRSFSGLAATFQRRFNLTGIDVPEQIQGYEVSPNFFEVMGVDAVLGRTFLTEDTVRTAVVSYGLWQRLFGGNPEIVGDVVTLNSQSYTVVGVMPPWFRFGAPQRSGSGRGSDVWIRALRGIPEPLVEEVEDLTTLRGLSYLRAVGRLESGVSLSEARSEMDVIARRLEKEYPDTNTGTGVHLVPLHEQIVGEARPALIVLFGAVGFVLLIVCANVANLMLARASGREREMAVRSSLGAGRKRLISQLLTESLLLYTIGGALGLIAAVWGTDLLLALEPGDLPRAADVGIDTGVLAFTFGISLMTGLIFGLIPALQASKPDLQSSLKEGTRGSVGSERRRILSLFVVSEVGLALILLIGAGLMIKSFFLLRNVDPGFSTENVLTLRVRLPEAEYGEDEQIVSFYSQTLERIRSLPGVQSAGGVLGVPLSNDVSGRFGILIEGRPDPGPGEEPPAPGYQVVSPDYFKTMGILLIDGRDFTSRDDADGPSVAVISQITARQIWPGENALGKRISFDREDWIEIVGIVGDVHHYELDEEPRPELYLPYRQVAFPFMTFVVRTAQDPLSLAGPVRSQIQEVDRNLPVFGVMTLAETLGQSVARPRFQMMVLGLFGAVALILAAVGIYGLLAYSVSKSTREIGIRMALGALSRDVLNLVVRRGMALALFGLGLGLLGALGLTRFLSSFLFQVAATDPWIFVVVPLFLAAVSFLASVLPALRATRVDPIHALRLE